MDQHRIDSGLRRRPGLRRAVATALVIGLAAGCSGKPAEPVTFVDVTAGSGLDTLVGMTHGAAWGDVDGDAKPDLYLTSHLNPPRLLRNLGNGRFEDITGQWFKPSDLEGDRHGAAWADVDNDGRLDLVQLTGAVMGVGQEAKRLFMNRGDHFDEVAQAQGVDNPQGRTRMPLWVDLNNDGKLDLIEGAESRLDDLNPPFTFVQQGSRFEKSDQALAFGGRGVPFCILTNLGSETRPDVICRVIGKNITAQVFSTMTAPATELKELLPVTAFEDVVAGDFDNDGAIDVFLARRNPPGKVAFGRPADNVAIADLWVSEKELGQTTEFSLQAKGKLSVKIAPKQPQGVLTPDRVHVGSSGKAPGGFEFVLDPQAPESAGLLGTSATEVQLRVGFETPDRWRIALVGPDGSRIEKARTAHVQIELTTDEPIRELKAAGDAERPEQAPQRLFMNRAGKLVEEGDKRGVNEKPIAAMSVVAADFNNDMWLDLFILGSGDVGMHQNVLLLNQGDGHFKAYPLTGGAEGPRMGVGDSVTTADVDGDGFVDLLIAAGGSMGRSLGLPSDRGVYRLFRNAGNANHWLEIDLEGTRSNRSSIGARVEVTAGGVTQVRVQDGGIHHRGQNQSRLHFGLATKQRADRIVVRWPDGTQQEVRDVPSDQLLLIRQAS